LNWSASVGASSYRISRGPGPGAYNISFTTADTTYTDSTAQNGTSYYYAIAAVNANDESLNSADVSATALAPPGNVTLTPGNAQVTVDWQLSTGATSYKVKRGTSPGTYSSLFTTAAPPYVDSTVLSNATYYYAVSAIKGGSESANSTEANVRLGTPGEIVWVDDQSNFPANAQLFADSG